MTVGDKRTNVRRWWVLGPLLAASAWLALFGDKTPESVAVSLPTRSPAPARVPPAAGPSVPAAPAPRQDTLAALVPRSELIPPSDPAAARESMRDPFSSRSWTPPPPPAPAVPATAQPVVAPPLPYAYIGKKFEGDAWEVYLSRADQTFVAQAGAVLDGGYRVDKIEPPLMTLTYLPLGLVQTFPIGDTR